MLTPEKVATYRKFGGDIDGFAVAGRKDPSGITAEEWRLIDELRLALLIVSSGRAAPEYAQALERRLATVVGDEPTRQAIRNLIA